MCSGEEDNTVAIVSAASIFFFLQKKMLLQHYAFCFLFFEQYPIPVQQFLKEYLIELKATVYTQFETNIPLPKQCTLCIVTPFQIPSSSLPSYRIITLSFLLYCLMQQKPPIPLEEEEIGEEEESLLFTPIPYTVYKPLQNQSICVIGYTPHEKRVMEFIIRSMGALFYPSLPTTSQCNIIIMEQPIKNSSQIAQHIHDKQWLLQTFSNYLKQ